MHEILYQDISKSIQSVPTIDGNHHVDSDDDDDDDDDHDHDYDHDDDDHDHDDFTDPFGNIYSCVGFYCVKFE